MKYNNIVNKIFKTFNVEYVDFNNWNQRVFAKLDIEFFNGSTPDYINPAKMLYGPEAIFNMIKAYYGQSLLNFESSQIDGQFKLTLLEILPLIYGKTLSLKRDVLTSLNPDNLTKIITKNKNEDPDINFLNNTTTTSLNSDMPGVDYTATDKATEKTNTKVVDKTIHITEFNDILNRYKDIVNIELRGFIIDILKSDDISRLFNTYVDFCSNENILSVIDIEFSKLVDLFQGVFTYNPVTKKFDFNTQLLPSGSGGSGLTSEQLHDINRIDEIDSRATNNSLSITQLINKDVSLQNSIDKKANISLDNINIGSGFGGKFLQIESDGHLIKVDDPAKDAIINASIANGILTLSQKDGDHINITLPVNNSGGGTIDKADLRVFGSMSDFNTWKATLPAGKGEIVYVNDYAGTTGNDKIILYYNEASGAHEIVLTDISAINSLQTQINTIKNIKLISNGVDTTLDNFPIGDKLVGDVEVKRRFDQISVQHNNVSYTLKTLPQGTKLITVTETNRLTQNYIKNINGKIITSDTAGINRFEIKPPDLNNPAFMIDNSNADGPVFRVGSSHRKVLDLINLATGGTGGTVDLTPVTNRLDSLETKSVIGDGGVVKTLKDITSTDPLTTQFNLKRELGFLFEAYNRINGETKSVNLIPTLVSTGLYTITLPTTTSNPTHFSLEFNNNTIMQAIPLSNNSVDMGNVTSNPNYKDGIIDVIKQTDGTFTVQFDIRHIAGTKPDMTIPITKIIYIGNNLNNLTIQKTVNNVVDALNYLNTIKASQISVVVLGEFIISIWKLITSKIYEGDDAFSLASGATQITIPLITDIPITIPAGTFISVIALSPTGAYIPIGAQLEAQTATSSIVGNIVVNRSEIIIDNIPANALRGVYHLKYIAQPNLVTRQELVDLQTKTAQLLIVSNTLINKVNALEHNQNAGGGTGGGTVPPALTADDGYGDIVHNTIIPVAGDPRTDAQKTAKDWITAHTSAANTYYAYYQIDGNWYSFRINSVNNTDNTLTIYKGASIDADIGLVNSWATGYWFGNQHWTKWSAGTGNPNARAFETLDKLFLSTTVYTIPPHVAKPIEAAFRLSFTAFANSALSTGTLTLAVIKQGVDITTYKSALKSAIRTIDANWDYGAEDAVKDISTLSKKIYLSTSESSKEHAIAIKQIKIHGGWIYNQPVVGSGDAIEWAVKEDNSQAWKKGFETTLANATQLFVIIEG